MKKKIVLLVSIAAFWGFANAQMPVARWSFNDGTAKNEIADLANGTITNAVSAGSYNGSKSFDFNGNDAKISFGDNLGAVFTDSVFSISLWIMPRAIKDKENNRSMLLSKWVSTGEPNNGFILWVDGFDSQSSSGVNDPLSVAFPAPKLNVWHHYMVRQNRDSLSIYIDTILVASSKTFMYKANTSALTLGALYNDVYNFDGKIDEVQVFDRCISSKEMDSLYKLMPNVTSFEANDMLVLKDSAKSISGTIVPDYDFDGFYRFESLDAKIASVNDTGLVTAHTLGATKMVIATQNNTLRDTFLVSVPDTTMFAYYTFDNKTASDLSFNGNNAEVLNALPTVSRFGEENAALAFGTADKVVKVKNIDLRSSQLSFAGWIFVNNFQSDMNHISSIVGIYENGWCGLRIGDAEWAEANRLQIVLGNANISQWVRLKSKTELQTKQYYHVAATYDGATVKLYINGKLDTATAYNQKISTFGKLEIGSSNGERPLDGTIDEVRIYKRAISAREIDSSFSLTPISKFDIGDSIAYLAVDSVLKLDIKTLPQYDMSQFISSSSSNEAVAGIVANTEIKALTVGESKVIVKTLNGTFKDSITIKVVKPVTQLILNKQSLSLLIDSSAQLVSTVLPSDATIKDLIYTSSNTAIARVSASGLVTAKSVGLVKIVVSSVSNPAIKDTCELTVSAPTPMENESDLQLSLLPNPANDIVSILGDRVSSLQVFTLQGQLMLSNMNANAISVSALKNGSYYVQITTDRVVKLLLIVVQH